jgi:hypothetical protein
LKGWKRYEPFLTGLLELVGPRVEYNLKTTLPGYVKSVEEKEDESSKLGDDISPT